MVFETKFGFGSWLRVEKVLALQRRFLLIKCAKLMQVFKIFGFPQKIK